MSTIESGSEEAAENANAATEGAKQCLVDRRAKTNRDTPTKTNV
jgi:hypothetical protein